MITLSPTRALDRYICEGETRRRLFFHYSLLVGWYAAMIFFAFFSPKSVIPYEIEISSFLLLSYIGLPYWINHVRGGGRDFLARLAVSNTRVFILTGVSLIIVTVVFGVTLGLIGEIPYGLDPEWVLFVLSTAITSWAVLLVAKAFWVATGTTPR